MKKLIPVLAVLFTCGCAVQAKEPVNDTLTATVIRNSEEETVLEVEETDGSESGAKYGRGEMITLSHHEKVLIMNDQGLVDADDLEKDERVVVTFCKDQAVIHIIDGEE